MLCAFCGQDTGGAWVCCKPCARRHVEAGGHRFEALVRPPGPPLPDTHALDPGGRLADDGGPPGAADPVGGVWATPGPPDAPACGGERTRIRLVGSCNFPDCDCPGERPVCPDYRGVH